MQVAKVLLLVVKCQEIILCAFSCIFGKVGRVTYENVIELLKAKCLPSLYYGLDLTSVSSGKYL